MPATPEEASLFLNLVSSKLKADTGSLKFLTGNNNHTISGYGTGQMQETQVLTFGTTIWIANNDDDDSETQKKYLEKVGVTTANELLTHVETYKTRIMGSWGTQVKKTHQLKPKEKYLFALAGDADTNLAPAMQNPGGGGAVSRYSLASTNPPPNAPIVVVVGAYEGEGGNSLHAEQKLIAAFGRYVQQNPAPYNVTISGNKPACSRCDAVLADASNRLGQLQFASNLNYTNTVSQMRRDAGLGADDPAGIRAADLDVYFG